MKLVPMLMVVAMVAAIGSSASAQSRDRGKPNRNPAPKATLGRPTTPPVSPYGKADQREQQRRTDERNRGNVDRNSPRTSPFDRNDRNDRDNRNDRNDRNNRNDRNDRNNRGNWDDRNNDRISQRHGQQPQAKPNYRWGSGNYRNDYRPYHNRPSTTFSFSGYGFQFGNDAYCSPFYDYGHLPGYVHRNRASSSISIRFGWGLGLRYEWCEPDYRNDRFDRNRELDRAIDDIKDAFRTERAYHLRDLVDRYDRVTVDLDNRPAYSLDGDDFLRLMEDVIERTDTISYRVSDIRVNGRYATLSMVHEYRDSWGDRETLKHYYGLQEDRNGYRIVSFRTDRW